MGVVVVGEGEGVCVRVCVFCGSATWTSAATRFAWTEACKLHHISLKFKLGFLGYAPEQPTATPTKMNLQISTKSQVQDS